MISMPKPQTRIPNRIQRRRTKGWTMPPGAVYVGRPTIWGNPFGTADQYGDWLDGDHSVIAEFTMSVPHRAHLMRIREVVLSRIEELRGKDLVCWCSLERICHADFLIERANPS